MQRVKLIEQRLQFALQPGYLEVIDDSERHRGHAGAQGGAGHYTVVISARFLQGLSRVAAHRKIYELLSDLIPHEIHALSIILK